MVRRVLVTGATGFLGGAVLRRLGAVGVGQGRNRARLRALAQHGLCTVHWSLPDVAPDNVELNDVSAIVHCAALSAPFGPRKAFFQSNVLGTQAVLDFAHRRGVKQVIYISSPSVYFKLSDQLDVREDMPLPNPFNAYAESKMAAERLVLAEKDLGPVVLRPRGIYGPDDTTLLPRLLRAAQARKLPRLRGGRAKIDLTYVDDVVEAVFAALKAGSAAEQQVFNISGGEVIGVSDIVEQTCERAGITPHWQDMPLKPALIAARAAELIAMLRPGQPEPPVTRYGLGLFSFEQSLDISRAQGRLGWAPKVCFSKGLDRTFAKQNSR